MTFKIGDQIVFTDEFKEVYNEDLKRENFLNIVFIISSIYEKYIYVSLDGITPIGTHLKEDFRLATEKEIKQDKLKNLFINKI
jgi:hypothetical protein